jgi:hypothetical protein
MSDHANPQPILNTVESLLATHHCRLQSTAHYEDKGQVVFVLTIPAGIDIRKLEAEVRARLRKANVSKIDVRV